MKVHHLNCATMCPRPTRALGLADGQALVAHCWLIETPADGLVLVDTGLGTAECETPARLGRLFRWSTRPRLDRSETALAHVMRRGFAPSDVRHIVVTHLDLDHAGGLADFPLATVHVHAREHGAAMARMTLPERTRYMPAQWQHGPRWNLVQEAGDTWFGLPAVQQLPGVKADIALVPLHGHTRGHSAVACRSNTGWLLHAGDAYFHYAAMHGDGREVPALVRTYERLLATDNNQRVKAASQLRALAAKHPDIHVHCAHDPSEFARCVSAAVAASPA